MKSLITSAAIMFVLICGWLFFGNYSEERLAGFSASIKDDIIPAVENENWEEGENKIASFSGRWHEYREKALLFLDTDEINEIDFGLAKAEKYIKSKDVSNSSGELNSLAEQLAFMREQQKLSLSNIL